jgi:hypothetical protein
MKKEALFFVWFCAVFVRAQYPVDLTYGVKIGGTWSKISNLSGMIISEDYYQGYSMESEPRWGATAGLFLNYKFPDTRIALQPEIMYTMQGGDLKYSDIKGLNYTIQFKYNYIALTTLVKVYIAGGFNLGAGPVLSFNLTPDNIEYKSNQSEFGFGDDIQTRQALRNVIKGKADFALSLNLGYEWENGLMIEGRYNLGLTDIIETQVNGYKFIENSNKSSVFILTISYAFNFDSRRNFR